MAALTKRTLKISVNGTDYTAVISKASITAADSENDFVTFYDAASGGAKDYFVNFTIAQDAASGSLWRQVWSNSGTDVPFLLKPYGNATASTSQPHFTGTATISLPDGDILGGDADASSTAKWSIDVSWQCLAKPTLVES